MLAERTQRVGECCCFFFQPPCSEAYYSRLSFRSKSKEQLNERRAGLSNECVQLALPLQYCDYLALGRETFLK